MLQLIIRFKINIVASACRTVGGERYREFMLHYCIWSLERTCFHPHKKEKPSLWSIRARKCITVPRKGVCAFVCAHLPLCMSKASTHTTGTRETRRNRLRA